MARPQNNCRRGGKGTSLDVREDRNATACRNFNRDAKMSLGNHVHREGWNQKKRVRVV